MTESQIYYLQKILSFKALLTYVYTNAILESVTLLYTSNQVALIIEIDYTIIMFSAYYISTSAYKN